MRKNKKKVAGGKQRDPLNYSPECTGMVQIKKKQTLPSMHNA